MELRRVMEGLEAVDPHSADFINRQLKKPQTQEEIKSMQEMVKVFTEQHRITEIMDRVREKASRTRQQLID
jgi:molybdenum cofactor biosynthesis enzyme MoaA